MTVFMDFYLITNQLTFMTWTSTANYIFGCCNIGLVRSWYQTKPIVTLLEIADLLCIVSTYTALRIFCLTDLYSEPCEDAQRIQKAQKGFN